MALISKPNSCLGFKLEKSFNLEKFDSELDCWILLSQDDQLYSPEGKFRKNWKFEEHLEILEYSHACDGVVSFDKTSKNDFVYVVVGFENFRDSLSYTENDEVVVFEAYSDMEKAQLAVKTLENYSLFYKELAKIEKDFRADFKQRKQKVVNLLNKPEFSALKKFQKPVANRYGYSSIKPNKLTLGNTVCILNAAGKEVELNCNFTRNWSCKLDRLEVLKLKTVE